MNTYQIHYLGCKASQADALGYAGMLQRAGWTEAVAESQVSLLLVQTCTVTMSADAQGRQLVRKLKREHPEAKVMLTGCYAQRAEEELTAMPEVDYVVGNLNPRKNEILTQIAAASFSEEFPDFPLPGEFSRTRPYIKIQDGCDARCSYCIIPAVRGKSRSLPVEEVVRRVELFRDRSYREMILTGISMGGYGKDLVPKSSLGRLMERLAMLSGDFRIRLSSVEPEEIDDLFLDTFNGSNRFQPHLHLPLQSASDRVLRKMRRQYLFKRYRNIVDRLFKSNPDLNLGTDILVGFPDEDDAAFLETYRYVQSGAFAYCHVFPFSARPETAAAGYSRCVTHQETHHRAKLLRREAGRKNLEYRRRFIEKELTGLLLPGTGTALTGNYIRVHLAYENGTTGFVSIRINSVDNDSTSGVVVN